MAAAKKAVNTGAVSAWAERRTRTNQKNVTKNGGGGSNAASGKWGLKWRESQKEEKSSKKRNESTYDRIETNEEQKSNRKTVQACLARGAGA